MKINPDIVEEYENSWWVAPEYEGDTDYMEHYWERERLGVTDEDYEKHVLNPKQRILELTKKDLEIFFEKLENPSKPNKALIEAVKEYNERN